MIKVLQLLVLILSFVIFVNAQVDCAVTNAIIIKDYDGNIIKNAKLEVLKVEQNFNKKYLFSPQKDDDDNFVIKTFTGKLITGTDKTHYIGENYRIRVKAEDFNDYEWSIKLKRCESQTINVRLEKIKQEIKVKGMIYDMSGAVIPGVIITAKDKSGEIFNTKSLGLDKNIGSYELKLFPSEYELTFESVGFKKYVIEQFVLINSTNGVIFRDIVMEVGEPNCPYVGPCEESKENNLIIETKIRKRVKN